MATNTKHFQAYPNPRFGLQLALLVLAALAALALLFMIAKPLKVLPRLAVAPPYTLTDQNGHPVADADLHGKVVLYDFVYTHCTTVCPAMTGQMLQVQKRLEEAGLLGSDVVLVTITFDPERDTPERLRQYAQQMYASPEGWFWLTGDPITIRRLVGGQFGVYFEKIASDQDNGGAVSHHHGSQPGGYDFVHATVFLLVDGDGVIRSEYRQMLDVDRAMRDIRLVVREQNAGVLVRPLWEAAHLVRAYP